MAEFSTEVWLALGLVAGVMLLAFLHTIAAGLRHAIAQHDLQVRVALLRREYLERLQEGELPPGVIEVGPEDEEEADFELLAA